MNQPRDTQKQNVVDLSQRKDGSGDSDRLGSLLKRVRGIAQRRLGAVVSALFENVDDSLFDLAERAESNAMQTEYFDGMREVRKKRQLVERLVNERTTRAFSDFAEGKPRPGRDAPATPPAAGLALVDNVDLEESLAVSSMVAKAESRLARPLFELNQRLSVLVGGATVDDAINPIGPSALASAFREAVREFQVILQVKLIVYKLFERYVMAGLEPLYDEVNIELIRAGVLPRIHHSVPHAARGPGVPYPAGARGPARTGVAAAEHARRPMSPMAGGYYDGADGGFQVGLYETLRSLLASRHAVADALGADPGEPADAGMDSVPLGAHEILAALTLLQGRAMAAQAQEAGASDAAAEVREIKRSLIEQARKFSNAERATRVSSADEDTIDLVGMLFEFILRDRNLPAEIQALLGRLQIPYLKVAIVDKHLFAQPGHPARRLLDALADAGKGWSPDADRDHRLYDRIKASVETILRDFDDDMGVFDRELADLSGFLAQHHKRAELAEQRVAEAARGREKLQNARRTAAHEILQRIDQRELPPVVHAVLARPWANYLVLTLLREGDESEQWHNALRFADEFVWSAQPKETDADRTRLRALLPQLERALRHGLATVAYGESDLHELMQKLRALYQRLLGGERTEVRTAREVIAEAVVPVPAESPAAGGDETSSAAAPPQPQSPVEEIVLSTGEDNQGEPEQDYPADDEFLQAARAIKVGTWLELTMEDGTQERVKLSWISPISGKYLFVNRRGLKVCDRTVFALAADLRRGSARVLAEVPLFDRALDAIVAKLRNGQDKPTPQPPGAANS